MKVRTAAGGAPEGKPTPPPPLHRLCARRCWRRIRRQGRGNRETNDPVLANLVARRGTDEHQVCVRSSRIPLLQTSGRYSHDPGVRRRERKIHELLAVLKQIAQIDPVSLGVEAQWS